MDTNIKKVSGQAVECQLYGQCYSENKPSRLYGLFASVCLSGRSTWNNLSNGTTFGLDIRDASHGAI